MSGPASDTFGFFAERVYVEPCVETPPLTQHVYIEVTCDPMSIIAAIGASVCLDKIGKHAAMEYWGLKEAEE